MTSFESAAPGEHFELVTQAITSEQLVRYAGASDDYARVHYDQPYALEAGLGGVIAHGMLTMAFMGRAATTWAGPRWQVKTLSGRFLAPVRLGEVVRVTARLLDRTRVGSIDHARCELVADVGGKSVATGETTLMQPTA